MTTLQDFISDERKMKELQELAQPCPHCGAALTFMYDHHGPYLEHAAADCIHDDVQIFNRRDMERWNRRT
jgi:hypothetical protein